MKDVFAYLRVSGKGQVDGDGFDRQEETINRYCDAKGWKVVRWFRDEAVTGTMDAGERPAFAEMLSLMGEQTTKVIVVERADRLARTLIVSELACEEARQQGFQIFEAASDTDLTGDGDPTRILIRQVLGALSEWNKNVLVKRLRVARERIRARTGRCEGKVPYGHRGDPEEAKVVKWIVEKRDSGWSWPMITKDLTRRRIPPPHAKKGDSLYYPAWSQATVGGIYVRESEMKGHSGKQRDAALAGLGII